jgi:hypothetical protein
VLNTTVEVSRSVSTIALAEISATASSLHSLSLPAYDIHDDAIVFTARVDSPTGPCWMVKYSLAARVVWTLRLPVDTLNVPHYCQFTRGIIGIHASTRVLKIDTVHGAVIYNQDGWSSASFNRQFWKIVAASRRWNVAEFFNWETSAGDRPVPTFSNQILGLSQQNQLSVEAAPGKCCQSLRRPRYPLFVGSLGDVWTLTMQSGAATSVRGRSDFLL